MNLGFVLLPTKKTRRIAMSEGLAVVQTRRCFQCVFVKKKRNRPLAVWQRNDEKKQQKKKKWFDRVEELEALSSSSGPNCLIQIHATFVAWF